MNKISIIGGSGTGKTTLSNNLSKELNIKAYHLDGLNYKENWVEVDKEDRDSKILELINKDKWIIDGTYSSTIKDRLKKSDLIIYLDYSSFSQLIGVFKRFFKNKNKEKPEVPGCKEQINFEFLKFVINWRKTKRENIMNILNNLKGKKILIFKNRHELNKWYKDNFNKKMKI